jgi:transposase-like protein
VLVELGLVEQRYRAVLEVLDDGATVVEVARRYGVGPPMRSQNASADGPAVQAPPDG